MKKKEWNLCGDFFLEAHGIVSFKSYEVADIGRTRHHWKTGQTVKLQAPPSYLMKNVVIIAEILQWVRNRLGDSAPVLVSSWYRDRFYNESIQGAAPNSLHLVGAAADIVKVGWEPKDLARAIWEEFPNSDLLGIGSYSDRGFVHVDARGFLGRMSPARFGTDEAWWK